MAGTPATQQEYWNSYLSTGRGATELFKSIDADENGTVSASEVAAFLDSVAREGVRPEEFEELEGLVADEDELTLSEFLSWLVGATSIDKHKEPEVQTRYESHASTGRRGSMLLTKKQEYSWNETTMAQNLRRMVSLIRLHYFALPSGTSHEISPTSTLLLSIAIRRARRGGHEGRNPPSRRTRDHLHECGQPSRGQTEAHHLLPAGPRSLRSSARMRRRPPQRRVRLPEGRHREGEGVQGGHWTGRHGQLQPQPR